MNSKASIKAVAFPKGRDAYKEGVDIEDCPYHFGKFRKWWRLGWLWEYDENHKESL